ncbi:hypothetical protein PINS_up023513 [Pythium insidiosum]|nr:hypothetical protein PINS_up023513 [Pythium insidiosum]
MAPSMPVSSLLLGGDLRQESLDDDYVELNPSQQPSTWRPTLRVLSAKSISARLLDAKAALLAKKPSIAQLRASLPSTARSTADYVRSSTRLSQLVPSRRPSFARLRKRQQRQRQQRDNQYDELDDDQVSLTSSDEEDDDYDDVEHELNARECYDVYVRDRGFYVEVPDVLVDRYDLFIIDQYGVLHNGTVAHAGARVVILSNTSRRATGVHALLASLGFSDGFHGVVTGGEAAWTYLNARREALATCALMTSSLEKSVRLREHNDQSLFHGLDLRVTTVDEADFLLVEGTLEVCYSDRAEDVIPIDFHTTGEFNAHIEAFIARGKIAKEYEARGGDVIYFGKPMKEHFEACIELVPGTEKTRVVHIGDSLHHDVLGARDTGIDSVFIAGGIHADQVFDEASDDDKHSGEKTLNLSKVEAICKATDIEPTYVLPFFTW